MPKDRNTFAKRQREVEQKRKATEKRERRAQKKLQDESCEPSNSQSSLSPAEQAVLGVYRKFLMTPGRMLCLSAKDVDTFALPLTQLINKGLLVAEKSPGAYSLTETGFAAMKAGQ